MLVLEQKYYVRYKKGDDVKSAVVSAPSRTTARERVRKRLGAHKILVMHPKTESAPSFMYASAKK